MKRPFFTVFLFAVTVFLAASARGQNLPRVFRYPEIALPEYTDAEIRLKIVEMLIQYHQPHATQRWLDRSGQADTLEGKRLAAALQKSQTPPERNFLLYIQYDPFHNAPRLPAETFQRYPGVF